MLVAPPTHPLPGLPARSRPSHVRVTSESRPSHVRVTSDEGHVRVTSDSDVTGHDSDVTPPPLLQAISAPSLAPLPAPGPARRPRPPIAWATPQSLLREGQGRDKGGTREGHGRDTGGTREGHGRDRGGTREGGHGRDKRRGTGEGQGRYACNM